MPKGLKRNEVRNLFGQSKLLRTMGLLPSPESLRLTPTPPLPKDEDNQFDLASLVGAGPDMPNRREYLFFLAASCLLLLGILAFLGYIFLEPPRQQLYQAVLKPERLRAAADYFGYWAQLLFIVAQALDVLIILPIPIEIAGGFLFGVAWGVVYSSLGLALGSMLAFLLGRWLEKKYILRLVSPNILKAVRRLIKREGTLTAFLIFLIPGIPKNFLCYLFGLSRISLPFFLMAATLARLPGTILLTFQGSLTDKGHHPFIPLFWILYGGLVLILYWRRESFYRWVSRRFLEDD